MKDSQCLNASCNMGVNAIRKQSCPVQARSYYRVYQYVFGFLSTYYRLFIPYLKRFGVAFYILEYLNTLRYLGD